jgi:hypothetical protein
MPTVSFPTTRTIECPLLIEANHLEALDKLLDQHLPQLQADRDKRIAEEASRRTRQYLLKRLITEEKAEAFEAKRKKELYEDYKYREVRSVSIYLTRGREVTAKNFSDAMNLPTGGEELPVGFSAVMRVGEIKATINTGYRYHRQLSIEVEPNDSEVALSLFGALSNWAGGIEFPKWQQKWCEYRFIAVALLFLFLVMGVLAIPLSNWSEAGKSTERKEARKLLASGGVTTNNERRAMELLLAIESNYSPPGFQAPSLGVKYWSYVSLGTLILSAVTICPGMCIGLWKGKRRLDAWRTWLRILTFGIPTLLGTYVLLPWILYWLRLIPPNP